MTPTLSTTTRHMTKTTKHTDKDIDRTPEPTDDKLHEIIMPEAKPVNDAPQPEPDDDEELDNKTARQRLIDTFNDDEGEKSNINLSYILRGDILTAQWFRRQLWWFIMVVVMAFAYVSIRFFAQQQQIHNNQLRNLLK